MTIYRKNLINYWRQWYPEWDIPNGFHVHHIVPRSCGGNDDPTNLIALHPDDHISIHKHRGDKFINDKFIISVKFGDENPSRDPRIANKISEALKGSSKSKQHRQKLSDAAKHQFETLGHPRQGAILSDETKQKIRNHNVGKKYSKEINMKKGRTGSQNASSKKVLIDGIEYPSIKNAVESTGLSRTQVKKYL